MDNKEDHKVIKLSSGVLDSEVQTMSAIQKKRGYYILLATAMVLTIFMWYLAVSQQKVEMTTAEPEVSEVPRASLYVAGEIENIYSSPTPAPIQQNEGGVISVSALAEKEQPFQPILPAIGVISKEFSDSTLIYSRTMEDWRTHNGIDITGDIGTQVKACSAGKIESISEDDMLGTVIVIWHGDEVATKYANLQPKTIVKVGDEVKQGEVVGGMGTSAAMEVGDTPHLHFEIMIDGKNVDPLAYIK